MTDALLALIPLYGLGLLFVCLVLSCLALPVPSSLLVMASGGFAAAGDFTLGELVLVVYVGFLIGDQIAYWGAWHLGASLLRRERLPSRVAMQVANGQALLERYGVFAVLITRTVLSPLGPYVSFACGALKLPWLRFSLASATGAVVWTCGYAGIGYVLSGQVAVITMVIENAVGTLVTGALVAAQLWWLIGRYRRSVTVQRTIGNVIP